MLVDHDEAYQNRVYLYAANRCVFVCFFFFGARGCVDMKHAEHINAMCVCGLCGAHHQKRDMRYVP